MIVGCVRVDVLWGDSGVFEEVGQPVEQPDDN